MTRTRHLLRLSVILTVSCSTQPPPTQCLIDPGLDNRLNWESEYATIAEGTALLRSPDGTVPAQIRQKLHTLKPYTNYVLSVRARSLNTPSAQLSVDLFADDGYDSPNQELVVPPDQIDATYRTFQRVINQQPYLRVFSYSTVPIEVDEVGLRPVN